MRPASPHALQVDRAVEIPLGRAGVASGRFVSFRGLPPDEEHFAIALGDPVRPRPLVRVHSECVTGDLFGSQRCDCGAQLDEALRRIGAVGGYLLYLRQEGRGIGLSAKLRAYTLQDDGLDTFEANAALGHPEDARSFAVAAAMLEALGVSALTLLTNNPDKAAALRAAGLDVEVEATGAFLTPYNARYLDAKRRRGHALG